MGGHSSVEYDANVLCVIYVGAELQHGIVCTHTDYLIFSDSTRYQQFFLL